MDYRGIILCNNKRIGADAINILHGEHEFYISINADLEEANEYLKCDNTDFVKNYNDELGNMDDYCYSASEDIHLRLCNQLINNIAKKYGKVNCHFIRTDNPYDFDFEKKIMNNKTFKKENKNESLFDDKIINESDLLKIPKIKEYYDNLIKK